MSMTAAAAGNTFEFSPWFFVAFGLMLVVASALGPLSRWHERHESKQIAKKPEMKPPSGLPGDDGTPGDGGETSIRG